MRLRDTLNHPSILRLLSFRRLSIFYDQRFQMGLTDEQKAQLVAFLNSL
jgi:hypothetical protein